MARTPAGKRRRGDTSFVPDLLSGPDAPLRELGSVLPMGGKQGAPHRQEPAESAARPAGPSGSSPSARYGHSVRDTIHSLALLPCARKEARSESAAAAGELVWNPRDRPTSQRFADVLAARTPKHRMSSCPDRGSARWLRRHVR